MKKINRRSITNSLSYKEMKNVKAGRGDGEGCLHIGAFCYYLGELILTGCNNDDFCKRIYGVGSYCISCP